MAKTIDFSRIFFETQDANEDRSALQLKRFMHALEHDKATIDLYFNSALFDQMSDLEADRGAWLDECSAAFCKPMQCQTRQGQSVSVCDLAANGKLNFNNQPQ